MSLGVYVINLDGSADRLAAIAERLGAFGVEFERVPAVDGRKLDLSTLEDYDDSRAERYMGRSLIGAEIGCYRSHLAAAARFVASGADYGLVLEDDVVPLCDPRQLLTQMAPVLDALDRQWILANLGAHRTLFGTRVSSFTVGTFTSTLQAAHYFPVLTRAILWSRRGAEAFLAGHDKIFAPVDNFFRHWLTRHGHGYALWPAPFTDAAFGSLIYAAGRSRGQRERRWYYQFAKHRRLFEDKVVAISRLSAYRLAGSGRNLHQPFVLDLADGQRGAHRVDVGRRGQGLDDEALEGGEV
jgi:glycosyl transferase family 25